MMENEKVTNKKQDGSPSSRSHRVMDFIAKILCLAIAFFIWFYAMSTDVVTLERDFTVSVNFENEVTLLENTGWSVLSGKGNNIVVTLKGKRNIINSIKEEDLYAYVDVSAVESAGRHELDIKLSAPSECEIVHTSGDSISTYIDKKVTKNVPVVCELVNSYIESDLKYEIDIVDEISISGAASEVRKVEYARAELSLGEISQSVNTTAQLTLVDAEKNEIQSPYLNMMTKIVNVTLRLYAEKEVPLKADYKYGYFNEKNSKITITPASVTIKGEPSVIRGIDRIVVATLDEKLFIDNTAKQNVSIVSPEGATIISGETSAVISVEHLSTAVKRFTVENIQFLQIGGLEYELKTETLNVDVRVPITLLSKIKAEHISATVNMSNHNPGDGVTVLPVIIDFSDEFEDSVYELGNYNVTVDIK